MSKSHPFFGKNEAWYIFGEFNDECLSTGNFVVHAKNTLAAGSYAECPHRHVED